MRNSARWLAGAIALLALGCSGGGGSTIVAPSTPSGTGTDFTPSAPIGQTDLTPGVSALGGEVASDDLAMSAMAIYTVDIDPVTLTGTATLKQKREAAANDDITDLDIAAYLTGRSFAISNVARSLTTIDISYTFTHPFNAPTSMTPPGSVTNRADLGAAVRVLILADLTGGGPSPTYFTGVKARTDIVTNANGYMDPGVLIDTTGFTATAFPYQVLVDEAKDNRTGISNGGVGAGNFAAPGGWQASNIVNGGSNNGWRGYGVIHQGQSATNTVSLDIAALTGSAFSFDVALVAKYGQPKSAKAQKLPASPADVVAFGYRAPHAAIDVEDVQFQYETGGFIADQASASTLYFDVRDWDARSTETTETDLSLDADASKVAVDESGAPVVEVSIPDVLGAAIGTVAVQDDDTGFGPGGDTFVDSGHSEDPIFYCGLVNKLPVGGQTAGTKVGLVRAVDVENGAVTPWHISLGFSGTPGAPPESVTYQSFEVNLAPDNANPTVTAGLTSTDPLLSGTAPQITITALDDLDDDNLTITVDWGDGNGFVAGTVVNGPGPYTPPAALNGPQMNNTDLVADTINVVLRVDDGQGGVTDTPLTYQLGPNRPPTVTGSVTGPSNPILSGTSAVTLTIGTVTDPEGNPVDIVIDWDNVGGTANQTVVGVTNGQVINSPGGVGNPNFNNNTSGTVNEVRTIPITATDNINPAAPVAPAITFNLGPNRIPVVGVQGSFTVASFTGGSSANVVQVLAPSGLSDPEGNAISIVSVGTGVPSGGPITAPAPGPNGPYTNPPTTTVNFVFRAVDTLHPGALGAVAAPPVNGVIVIPPCVPTVTIFTADFANQVGANAWVPGTALVPALPNSDASGYSYFRGPGAVYCNPNVAQTTLTSPGFLHNGTDVGFVDCGINAGAWINDTGGTVANNIASPVFSLVGRTNGNVVFNASRSAPATASFRLYISANGGTTWLPASYSVNSTGPATVNETNVTVPIPAAALGSANCRLRFEYVDSGGYFSTAGLAAGWSFDTVRIIVCP